MPTSRGSLSDVSGDEPTEKAEDFSLTLSEDLLAAAVEAVEKRLQSPGESEGQDGEPVDVELTEEQADGEIELDLDEVLQKIDWEDPPPSADEGPDPLDEDDEDVDDDDSALMVDAEKLQLLALVESIGAEKDGAVARLAHKDTEVEHLRNVAEKLQAEVARLKEVNLKLSVRGKRLKEGYERQRLRQEDALAKVRQLEDLLGKARETVRSQEEETIRSRARHVREIEETKVFGNEGFFRELLPVLDHMDLALAHADGTPPDKMVEGVTMIYAQLEGTLRRMGLEKIDPEPGSPFDPTHHEAMKHLESEEIEAGAVVEILQTGFVLKDRLIRAARVTVSSGDGLDEQPVEDSGEVEDRDVDEASAEE